MMERKREQRRPSRLEINPIPEDLDGQWAEKKFFDKSFHEAEFMFREDAISRAQDLIWMGPVGFMYYFDAALNFLKSEFSVEESDFINVMTDNLESRLFSKYNDFDQIKDGVPKYIDFCEYALKYFEKFDIDEGVYGNLKGRIESLLDRLTKHS